jgi:predicted RNase H-like HicB family nuclease
MNEDLRTWFKEKWKDISRKKKGGGYPACGASAGKGVRAKDSSRKYPKCVPANKAKNMSKKQKKSAVTRKRRAPNEPGSPDNVKTDVKKESWENWKPKSEKVYSKNLPSNNAPENPEPIGGAVAFEKSREKVLADLKEMINQLVKEALDEQTIPARPGAISAAAAAAKDPEQAKQQKINDINDAISLLNRDEKELTPEQKRDLENFVIKYAYDTIGTKKKPMYREEDLSRLSDIAGYGNFTKIINDKIPNMSEKGGQIYSALELYDGKRALAGSKQPASAGIKTSSSPKQQTVDVSKTIEVLKSKEVQDAIQGYIGKLKAAGVSSPEISKKIADLGGMIDPNYPTAIAASTISGLDPRYLGPPQISPEEKNVFQKVKGFFGLNEEETKQLMESYNIRTQKDFDILLEAVVKVILKEGK